MRNFVVATSAVIAFTAAVLGHAATAMAEPFDGSGADTTVNALRGQGYNLQVNGSTNVPLSRCSVTGIHPSNLDESASLEDKQHTLVTVDVSCPSH
jgi:hypothetical protein